MTTSSLGSSSVVFNENPSTVEIFQAIKPRMCLIKTSKGQASGCFVSKDGTIAVIKHFGTEILNKSDVITVQYGEKKYTACLLPNIDKSLVDKLDICLLKIKENVEVPYFDILEKKQEVLEGEKVYFGGISPNQKPVFSKGFVSSKNQEEEPQKTFMIKGIDRKSSGGSIVVIHDKKLFLAGIVLPFFEASKMRKVLNELGKSKNLNEFDHNFTYLDGTSETLTSKNVMKKLSELFEKTQSKERKVIDARNLHTLKSPKSHVNSPKKVAIGDLLKGSWAHKNWSFNYQEQLVDAEAFKSGWRAIHIVVKPDKELYYACYKFQLISGILEQYNAKKKEFLENLMKEVASRFSSDGLFGFPLEFSVHVNKSLVNGSIVNLKIGSKIEDFR